MTHKYTDRFIRFPIKLFNQEEYDLSGEEITTDSYMMINPLHIASYRPSMEENGNATHVSFKDGSTNLVYVRIDLFEEIINKHQQ